MLQTMLHSKYRTFGRGEHVKWQPWQNENHLIEVPRPGRIESLAVLPLTNLETGIGSFVTFSEISFSFRVTPLIAAAGVAFSLLMGLMGGLVPAIGAARKEILTALRQV